ncbi:hypothetical protein [Shewanella sp. 10N.286.48.B5]|uniref:hypothetical protein n=1 Tax=Shewanella sp. 10N.286.48.B5 TaxID=1880834 RepID=UPI000C838F59|nr:hypothetical protein [Shewanella sp. 10N.286.48.B5]PMH88078.1 hypothetical protein BCU57_20135 [Shewanella sp. 10N.286.48.B5]
MLATAEQQQIVLNGCGAPLLQAAIDINFAARYEALLSEFPKVEDYIWPKHYVSLTRQQEMVTEVSTAAGMPMRYYKATGGWWERTKKYPRQDIRAKIEMRQWVTFGMRVIPPASHYGGGGSFDDIWNALRLHRGEVLDYDADIQTPHSPWCYTEQAYYTVLTEGFQLLQDLELLLPQGCTEGWRVKTDEML